MVVSKRQMKVESDRYGGFGNESMRFDSITAPSDLDLEDDVIVSDSGTEEMDIVSKKQTAIRQEEQAATVTAPTTRTDLPKRQIKEKKERNLEDLMPSIKTRAYMSDSEEAVHDEQIEEQVVAERAASPVRERYALTKRMKVAAVIYIAVALALAVAVISVGVSISQTSASVDALTASIAQKQAILAAGEAELADKLDEDAIRRAAEELGMVAAEDPAIEVPTVEKSDYPMPEPHTNGFDEFCDWLAGLLL